jgi:pilus assembly protein CpaB
VRDGGGTRAAAAPKVAPKTHFQYAFATMNKKALIAALLAGLIGAGMLYLYMQRFEAEATGGEKIPVVMATQDIPLGAVITSQMIGIRAIPSAYVEDRHIRGSEASKIEGVRVSSRVKANESVLWTDLATTTGQRRDLSSLVQNGFRAISVEADTSSTFGGLLQPGDRVDVLLTTDPRAHKQVTVPLLQNVLVLAVGQDTGAREDKKGKGRRRTQQITLSATVDQASVLTYATSIGRLSTTLRHPDDLQILEGLPETDEDDILEPEQRRRLYHREKRDERPTVPRPL